LWSGYTAEIKTLKIWKRLHGIEFLSFYLELFAIRALYERSSSLIAANVLTVLQAIADKLETWCIVEPANSKNHLLLTVRRLGHGVDCALFVPPPFVFFFDTAKNRL
jgi:hypothetical protein